MIRRLHTRCPMRYVRAIPAATLAVLTLLAFAAIAGSASARITPRSTSARTVVGSERTDEWGTVLAAAHGRALYVFAGGRVPCNRACLRVWKPLVVAHGVTAARRSGASAARLTTIRLANGTRQATYFGQPLFEYAGDHHAGQTNGQAQTQFGSPWFLLATNGDLDFCPQNTICQSY
jgi:predicted lipoprotein with Yx(FWY)xxD motif